MKKQTNYVLQIVIFIFGLILVTVVFSLVNNDNTTKTISYDQLKQQIIEDKINEITINPTTNIYEIYSGEAPNKTLTTIPSDSSFIDEMASIVKDNDVSVITNKQTIKGSRISSILSVVFFLLLGYIIFSMIKKFSGKGPGAGIIGNKARLSTDTNIKFKDVIGYDEEKHELVEIIDFLKNPEKYEKIGAKIPNGVLLEGPPGTGKTLIAKAVAGEANVPFYFISGSDFIEMYVGVGAARVRSLFKEAKKQSKAIIFIDEIDAIGTRENSSMGGRNTEQEQTINQLLVEMDGFQTSKGGIIVIGATNRSDKLDPAILRPGRFDRKIVVNLPQIYERELILKYHADKRKYDESISFKELSKMTTGMSGAQLEAVTNEAAILAVRNDRKKFNYDDVNEAIDRVLMGPAKISNKYSQKDKDIVSYHESGHAIVGLELEFSNKVQKITIVPRRDAGGYVSFTPDEEHTKMITKAQLLDQLVGLMGGRAAEEIFIKSISTGAYSDYEQASMIARAMVTQYAMSDLGLCQYESNRYLEGYEQKSFSDLTNEKIDIETNKILINAYNKACEIITRRSDDMHLLAEYIQKYETLDRVQINTLISERKLEL